MHQLGACRDAYIELYRDHDYAKEYEEIAHDAFNSIRDDAIARDDFRQSKAAKQAKPTERAAAAAERHPRRVPKFTHAASGGGTHDGRQPCPRCMVRWGGDGAHGPPHNYSRNCLESDHFDGGFNYMLPEYMPVQCPACLGKHVKHTYMPGCDKRDSMPMVVQAKYELMQARAASTQGSGQEEEDFGQEGSGRLGAAVAVADDDDAVVTSICEERDAGGDANAMDVEAVGGAATAQEQVVEQE